MADLVDLKQKVNKAILPEENNDFSGNIISFEKHQKLRDTQNGEDENEDINELINQAVKNIYKEAASDAIIEKLPLSTNFKNEKEAPDFIEELLNIELTKENFEDVFSLNKFKAVEFPFSDEEHIRNIRYKDEHKNTLAIVQINNNNNKIRLQTFGNVLPKQEFLNPQMVNYKVMNESGANGWTTEYGGVNQFDGSIEIRYKDDEDKVMAAVIFKSDGTVDTVVEYRYNNGKKIQMLHTSEFGHSKTIYDEVTDIAKLIVDIDTDGNICSITSGLSGEVEELKNYKK